MKISRRNLKRLIEQVVFQNEASKTVTSKHGRKVEALNTLKNAATSGDLEIDAKHLGIKSLKKFGKIKLASEFDEEDGKLTFKIDPTFQKKFKVKGLGNVKFEFAEEAASVTPEFAKKVELPGLQGKFSLGVKFKSKYKDISDVDPKKAFQGVYAKFSGTF